MAAPDLVSQFLTQGVYLRGWSPKTVEVYRLSLAAFTSALDGVSEPSSLSVAHLRRFVIGMRERGLTNGGCNVRVAR